MSVFARIRVVVKFRHKPFQIFWKFEKIFTELGDTAPQSWTDFGNCRKIQDPWSKPWDSIYGLYGPALARAASPSSSAESRSVLNLLLARSPRLLGVWRPSGYLAKLLEMKVPFMNIVSIFLTIHDLKYSKQNSKFCQKLVYDSIRFSNKTGTHLLKSVLQKSLRHAVDSITVKSTFDNYIFYRNPLNLPF